MICGGRRFATWYDSAFLSASPWRFPGTETRSVFDRYDIVCSADLIEARQRIEKRATNGFTENASGEALVQMPTRC